MCLLLCLSPLKLDGSLRHAGRQRIYCNQSFENDGLCRTQKDRGRVPLLGGGSPMKKQNLFTRRTRRVKALGTEETGRGKQ